MESTPHFNVTLDKDKWETEIIDLVGKIKPTWDKKSLEIKPLHGSVMNKLYHVTYKNNTTQSPLVVRINGSISQQYGIDRKQEVDFLRMLSGTKITPDLVTSFDNGIVYEYIAGDKMTKADVERQGILRKIAYTLAELHSSSPCDVTCDGSHQPHIVKLVSMTTKCIPDCCEINIRIPDELPTKHQIHSELKQLTDHMTDMKLPLMLSHNDMWLGNIILNKTTEEIRFIDCEHMGYNYAGFDIAHLHVGITGLEPDETKFKDFIKDYLRKTEEISSPNKVTEYVTSDESIDNLYRQCLKCHVINMLYGTSLYLSLYGQEGMSSGSGVMDCEVIEAACKFYKHYLNGKSKYLPDLQ